MTTPERDLRLFVALELPDSMKEALAETMDELRSRGATPLRWVRPEGIHLTLKFLGNVSPARLPNVEAALVKAVPAPFAISLTLEGLGTFGGPNRTRVVWVGVGGQTQELAGLARRIDEALAGAGFAREDRPFAAHLTLARVPDDASPAERRRLHEIVQSVQPPSLDPVRFTEVSLMQSTLQRGGAVYQRLAAYPRGQYPPEADPP